MLNKKVNVLETISKMNSWNNWKGFTCRRKYLDGAFKKNIWMYVTLPGEKKKKRILCSSKSQKKGTVVGIYSKTDFGSM